MCIRDRTYREASYLAARAGSSFKARVGANKHNQDSPYPEEDWWALYGAMAKELDPEGKITDVTAVLYGTPSNLEQAASWTAYTTDCLLYTSSPAGRASGPLQAIQKQQENRQGFPAAFFGGF